MIDIFPEVTVVGSKVALMYLKGLTHRPFEQKAVKGGDKIDLGGGHVFEFVMAPNLHWPDTIFSFDHATGCLFLHLVALIALAVACLVKSNPSSARMQTASHAAATSCKAGSEASCGLQG